jgi:hypothetical protein
MESPAYWGEAERVVSRVITEYQNLEPDWCGGSLEMAITNALREVGLLPALEGNVHNHFTREITPTTCEACANTVTGKRMLENDSGSTD